MYTTSVMKKDIHPIMQPVIFRDTGAGVDFITTSTKTSEEKEVIDGVEYSVIPVEISSASHPFYTGEENIIDSAGRVEKFKVRAGKKAEKGRKQRSAIADTPVDRNIQSLSGGKQGRKEKNARHMNDTQQ